MTVLLYEPNKVFRAVLANRLEELGLDVVSAISADQALTLVNKHQFKLICAGAQPTQVAAIDFIQQIRSQEIGNTPIPLIIFTDDENKIDLAALLETGATEVFHKNRITDFSTYIHNLCFKLEEQKQLQGRVLLVEDDEAISLYMSLILEQTGLKVTTTPTAENALLILENTDFDLIITDFLLEGVMSGLGLVQTVQNLNEVKARIPVLAISSMSDTSRRVEFLRAGASDFIVKPVLPEELIARVNNLVTNKKLVDQLELQQKRLKHLSMIDQLTGVYNRHALLGISGKYISEAIRHDYSLCAVVIDLDYFKKVNDAHGHSAGDSVLKAVSGLLQAECRTEDFVARFGGEEFIIILSHCDVEEAQIKMERLRKNIETLNPDGIPVTASFGIADFNKADYEQGFDGIFNRADVALYSAKNKGRNRVECN